MKTIGIIGTRRRDTVEDYKLVLSKVLEIYQIGDWLVSGGCPKGGDRFAEMIAKHLQTTITIYYAAWDRLGKKAGFVRNTEIANDSDELVACVAPDRTGGTEDTIEKFLRRLENDHLHLV